MIRSRAVSLALVGLFVCLAACHTYTQIELADAAAHGKIRVTLTDGERHTLRDPSVDADRIRGHETSGSDREYYEPPVVSFPLGQVALVESVHGDALKTVGVVLLVPVGILAVTFAVWGIACGWCL